MQQELCTVDSQEISIERLKLILRGLANPVSSGSSSKSELSRSFRQTSEHGCHYCEGEDSPQSLD